LGIAEATSALAKEMAAVMEEHTCSANSSVCLLLGAGG
jgi:hypothetical protein